MHFYDFLVLTLVTQWIFCSEPTINEKPGALR